MSNTGVTQVTFVTQVTNTIHVGVNLRKDRKDGDYHGKEKGT